MKINEHVKLSNQNNAFNWLNYFILFILFLFSKYTLSINLIMMILNKRIKPEEVKKINEHVKLCNQMLSIDWIILFYLFYFYFPNTHSPSI